jgi:hypothetical protein
VVTAGRTAPASSGPGSTHRQCGKLHGVLEEGLGGWDVAWSGRKKELGATSSKGGRRCIRVSIMHTFDPLCVLK